MSPSVFGRDVMQVCRSGHVITERLRSHPEQARSHCDRCGAATLHCCPTCGRELAGAADVPGLEPLGSGPPPSFCCECGAPFPWARRPPPSGSPGAVLEALLRRLPRVARQLRQRQGDRTPFRVEDAHDLEDLTRALLPVYFDDVRPQCRTPTYAPGRRTDFLLAAERIILVVKQVTSARGETALTEEAREDVAHYARQPGCGTLVLLFYDPQGLLPDPAAFEAAGIRTEGELSVRSVVAR
jgi:hypothetical protein